MKDGEVVEYDSPEALIDDPLSEFSKIKPGECQWK